MSKPSKTSKRANDDKAVIFVRVSTQKQETDRQESELRQAAEHRGWELLGTSVIREKISGAKRNEDRPGVRELLDLARAGKIRRVMVSEVSRLGRSTLEVLKTVESLTENGVSIYLANMGMQTLREDGSEEPMTRTILTLLAEFARMERELLRERVMSGLDEARRKGKTLGRPKGRKQTPAETLERYAGVARDLREGKLSIRQVAAVRHVSTGTVGKVKRAMAGEAV